MVVKGIIKSIDFNGNSCVVRIPYFETAGSHEVSCTALISNMPGIYNGYKENDVVWVAFEDGRMETPVVIGKLYLGVAEEAKDPRGSINCVNSTTSNNASIPFDTKLSNTIETGTINTKAQYRSLESLAANLNRVNIEQGQNNRDLGNRIRTVVEDSGVYSYIDQTAEKIEAEVGEVSSQLDGKLDITRKTPLKFGWDLTVAGWTVYTEGKIQDTENRNILSIQASLYNTNKTIFINNTDTRITPEDLCSKITLEFIKQWSSPGYVNDKYTYIDEGETKTSPVNVFIQTNFLKTAVKNVPGLTDQDYTTHGSTYIDKVSKINVITYDQTIPDNTPVSAGWNAFISTADTGHELYYLINQYETAGTYGSLTTIYSKLCKIKGYIIFNGVASTNWYLLTYYEDNGVDIPINLARTPITDIKNSLLQIDRNGLYVNGLVNAQRGHIGVFNIGGEHLDIDNNIASGIYSDNYIKKFSETPTGKGVYVGTDGIKLGTAFSLDQNGFITLNNGNINMGREVTNYSATPIISLGNLAISNNYWQLPVIAQYENLATLPEPETFSGDYTVTFSKFPADLTVYCDLPNIYKDGDKYVADVTIYTYLNGEPVCGDDFENDIVVTCTLEWWVDNITYSYEQEIALEYSSHITDASIRTNITYAGPVENEKASVVLANQEENTYTDNISISIAKDTNLAVKYYDVVESTEVADLKYYTSKISSPDSGEEITIQTYGDYNFKLDNEGNLTATKGYIGKFEIGAEHTVGSIVHSSLKTNGYIDSYSEDPGDRQGVYVGTDGIKLGSNFSIDPDGKVTATRLSITPEQVTGFDDEVKTVVTPGYIEAMNIATKKIEVKDDSNNPIFLADADTHYTKIGGFYASDTALHTGTKTTITSNEAGAYFGTDGFTFTTSKSGAYMPSTTLYINGIDDDSPYAKCPILENIGLLNSRIAIYDNNALSDEEEEKAKEKGEKGEPHALHYQFPTCGSNSYYIHADYLSGVGGPGVKFIYNVTIHGNETLTIPYDKIGTDSFYNPLVFNIISVVTTPIFMPSDPTYDHYCITVKADNGTRKLYVRNSEEADHNFYMIILCVYDFEKRKEEEEEE